MQALEVTKVGHEILTALQVWHLLPKGFSYDAPHFGVKVEAKIVELSSGETFLVFERPVPIKRYRWSWLGRDGEGVQHVQRYLLPGFEMKDGKWQMRDALMAQAVDLNGQLSPVLLPAYECLVPGAVLDLQQPFQRVPQWGRWEGECMSSGRFAVPCTRPHGLADWNYWRRVWPDWAHKLIMVSDMSWPRLVDAIEGHYPDRVFVNEEWARADFSPARAVARLVREQKERRQANTGCFHGHEGSCISFSAGPGIRLLWTLKSNNGDVFVVDSPDVQACYIFIDQRQAEDWASGCVTWLEARQHAVRVVHQGAWEARINAVLGDLGVDPLAAAG